MKTLDEVIKALSICGRHPDCEDCPYENVSYPTEIGNTCKDVMHYDAFHYLKTIETTENLYHDAVNELSKWKDEDWKDRYLPLTWDELQLMEGKPVWVEILSDEIDLSSRWMMVAQETKAHSLPLAYTDDIGHWIYGHEDKLGKSWQAYRKERNESNFCPNCGADMREDIPIEYFENGGI